MNRKLMVMVLESLEEAYPSFLRVEKLIKMLNLTLDGEFFKIITYLRKTRKIVIDFAENKYLIPMGYGPAQRDDLILGDEISIDPDGIDFLNEIKLIDSNEKRSEVITKTTIVIGLAAFLQILFYILSKNFSIGISNSSEIIPKIFLLLVGILLIGIIVSLLMSSLSDLYFNIPKNFSRLIEKIKEKNKKEK